MNLIVRAFPLLVSPEELQRFIDAMLANPARHAFYRRYNIAHESWHLQAIPGGHQVICVTQMHELTDEPERYAASDQSFDVWFKEHVQRLTGIDPTVAPLGPPSHEVYGFTDPVQRPGAGPLRLD
ncbi:hypothetical protein C7S18_08870 [Ahniella affigens]|uniref:Uncharacterized protein n=1 Tax=Ahniella affigens TaxID=2021234 RepID=A0A2P1PR14_9GAMM|nr:hypothetical protein [Ahniella affigens]AVP97296.1 hypothetical protein C7S18_08870 [Ahniella affigens]